MLAAVDPNVRYALEEVVDWIPSSFTSTRDETGITIVGSCPRCGHDVDKHIDPRVFSFDDEAEGQQIDEDVIRCNCLHTHEGGSPGQGCGRYWGVEIEHL